MEPSQPAVCKAAARGQQKLWYDLFFQRATLSGGEPTVLAVPITIELDQTTLKTGGDVFLEPAVKGVNGVVNLFIAVVICSLKVVSKTVV